MKTSDLKFKISVLAPTIFLSLYFLLPFSVNALTTITPNMSLTSGLVGWWTFDGRDVVNGVAIDKSISGSDGNLLSIATSTFYTVGKLDQAFNFDGVDDYIQTGNQTLKTLNNFTISFWFNSSVSTASLIFWEGQSTANGWGSEQELNVGIGSITDGAGAVSNNTFSFFLGSTTGSINNINIIKSFTDVSKWHFVVVTVSNISTAPSAEMFFDNVSVGTDTGTAGIVRTGWNTNLRFGRPGTASRFLKGYLDDVRIYNRILSSSEIIQLYKQRPPTKINATPKDALKNGLVGWWTMDGKEVVNGIVSDKSGNGNIANLINIATSTFYTIGKVGQAFNFDGTNDYASTTIGGTSAGTNATFSAWVYPRSKANYKAIVESRANTLQGLLLSGASGNPVTYDWDGDAGEYTAATGLNLLLNQWNFVAFSLTANSAKGYLYNSSGLTTYSDSNANASLGLNGQWHIARDTASSARYWNGLMDDVRVYSRALSAAEVSQLYNEGAGSKINATPKDALKTGLVGWWTMDGKEVVNSVALDKSGNGNNGNPINIASSTFYTIGKIGQAFKFDGVNDFIDSTNFADNLGSFSVVFWLKSSQQTSSFTSVPIISKISLGSEATGNGWGLYFKGLVGTQVGNLEAILQSNDGSAWKVVYNSAIRYNDNKWHYIVMQVNNNTINLYVDGAVIATTPNNSGTLGSYTNTSNVRVAKDYDSQYFQGMIDDVRIYSRAISASEITQLYNQGH